MTNANECTCPSGDGSLRHPCPAHPESVELAGVAAKLTFINGRPAMCGCQVEYSSGGGEYSDVIYVTLCAKHSRSAILDLVATNRIALTPEYEGQWHADLYLDREAPLAKAEGATPAEAVLALMSAERIDPEQESVEQAGGDERAAFFKHLIGRHPAHETEIVRVLEHNYAAWKAWQARAALAQPSPVQELDFSKPLETENGDPVKWICADVIEYKSARVCVAKDTGLVYSSPYIGLKIRNVMPEQAEAERPEVVAYQAVDAEDGTCLSLREDFFGYTVTGKEPLMTVAQHERIIGALTRDHAHVEEHLSQQIDILRINLAAKRDNLDAAMARVAELEKQEPVGWANFRDGRFGAYLHRTEDDARRFDSTALAGKPAGSKQLALYAAPVAQAQHSVPDDVETFLGEVRAELLRARSKFPGDRIMTIALAEEFGELCKAVLDEPAANVRKEAVQTAVMAARVVLDGDGSVTAWRAERGLDPLAAAPGKEVGHE